MQLVFRGVKGEGGRWAGRGKRERESAAWPCPGVRKDNSGWLVQTPCQLEERQPPALGREVSRGAVQTHSRGESPALMLIQPFLPSAEK